MLQREETSACATKIRVLLLSVEVISSQPIINYCIQISESINLAICFLSCAFVNACQSNRSHVSASCSRELTYLRSRVPNIRLVALFTES